MTISETFVPKVSSWPTDLYLLRHAQPNRDNVPRPDMNNPDWEIETYLIDKYQELKEGIGPRQARAAGVRLAGMAPVARFCLSGDLDRNLQTAWEVVAQYPEESRPQVIDQPLVRERYRGEDSPILISKKEFYERFPEQAAIRETTPSLWHPRGGMPYLGSQIRLAAALDDFVLAGKRENERQLLISTSGEFCIAQFNSPYLGNMSDEELVRGFGPGMPALEYEMTAITRYTKREDPENEQDMHITDHYGYMRVMTPNPEQPEGELTWDTGWIPIHHQPAA